MTQFPRTTVGGVSVSRMVIGTNWIRGFSHTSKAKDNFLKGYHTRQTMADILTVFMSEGVDAIVGSWDSDQDPTHLAILDAQERTGRKMTIFSTPHFNVRPGEPAELEPARVFDRCRNLGATFCMPHQCITDVLIDRLDRKIRQWERLAPMIRERGMIPGLSTHMPETVGIADQSGADVETYIQIYNAAGFMMSLEVDWTMRVIHKAKKPVLTIKPLAAGHLMPAVGLAFVWSTIRPCDMVAIGTMSPDEARESIELSLAFMEGRLPGIELQTTRSKKGL